MRLSELSEATAGALRGAGAALVDLMTPTVRLGVTGLARSGKTVFITALVRNLIAGGRLPFFAAMSEGRIVRAYLEPQPDDRVPRFAYEEHLADLARDPPQWPQSTRRISQLRITIEYVPASALRRALGPGRLHVDIVDYPGEWLIDLPLMELSFADWSRLAVADARNPRRVRAADAWLSHLAGLDADAPANEQVALAGAALFTAYLQAARSPDPELVPPGPGRFLLPGELAGSPLLTFFPLPPAHGDQYRRGSLGAMLARRFDSYKTHVVEPFFRDHFARLDRQIVLIDALSAVNAGSAALADLQASMEAILKCFRPGAHTWLSAVLPRRIDRLVFAATKADHLHHTSHDRLEAILRLLVDKAMARAAFAGAEVKVMALSALRSTREAEARQGRQRLPCIVGVPMPGERLAGKQYDGRTEAAIFPGDLPADPATLAAGQASGVAAGLHPSIHFVRFRPPRLVLETPTGEEPALPHIRLDRAIEFLIGDRLA
ncbi:MAG TPA: YcjX family protein [Hyphomicrobiaceae bacterium]|nr:YcjX family protein [Hyphomicrobiaceae bacterium]